MILSRKRRFLFIHIYKTAGTSITQALLPLAAPAWQFQANRLLRRIGILSLCPQPYPDHIKAAELAARMGLRAFKSYFTFAIVRNPWDWQVSIYNEMLKSPHHHQHQFAKGFSSFRDYIRWRCAEEVRFQKDFIVSGNGEVLVDFVGRFERLEDDFRDICARIGASTVLPRLNVSATRPYQEYYDRETRELVGAAFEPDVRMFGYDFD